MRHALMDKTKVFLNMASEAANGGFEVEIKKTIGYGATCIVYEVCYIETFANQTYYHNGILKEFYPVDRSYCNYEIVRGINNELEIPQKSLESFIAEKSRFLSGYKKLTNLRFENADMTNDISDGQWILTGNNTVYLLFSLDSGLNYGEYREENIYDIINMAISLTEVIGKYHEKNMIHMDIKPENILVLDREKCIIRLFDFDSVTNMDELKKNPIDAISFSREWAAPEIISLKVDEICSATDLYSIGAIVFERIMNRMPEMADKKNFAKYQFPSESTLFAGVSPLIYKKLGELFRKTLCVTVQKRVQTTKELLEMLLKIRKLADPCQPFLKDCRNETWTQGTRFIGRESEEKQIKEMMNKYDFIFVRGIGGIGKTSLIKEYAYKSNFETVYYSKQNGSLRDYIVSIPFANLNDAEWITDTNGIKDDSALLKYKLDLLCELDENSLIIVDNYDGEQGEFYNKLISCGAKVIFATRCWISYYKDQALSISEMSNEECRELFSNFCSSNIQNIDLLFEIINRNTLLIKLIACTINNSMGLLTIDNIIDKLKTNSLKEVLVNVKHSDAKTENIISQSVYAHLIALFDMADINEEQIVILKHFSLMLGEEISTEEYFEIANKKNIYNTINNINELKDKGWLTVETNVLSLHPMIAEIILEDEKNKPTLFDSKEFIMTLLEYGKNTDAINYEKKYKFLRMSVNALLKIKELVLDDFYTFAEMFGNVSFEGLYDEGQRLMDRMIPLCNKEETEEQKAVKAVIIASKALVESISGRVDNATKLFKEVNRITEDVNMKEYPDFLSLIFYNLSLHCKMVNQTEKALSYLKAYRKLISVSIDKETEIDIKINEANTYYVSGNYDMSIKLYQELEKELVNANHEYAVEKINIWLGLGLNFFQTSSLDVALRYYDKIMQNIDNVLSKFSPIRSSIFNNLGLFYAETGDFRKARICYSEALDIAKRIYHEDGKIFLTIMLNYVDFLRKSGEDQKAREIVLKIIDDLKNREEFILELANALNMLGVLDSSNGNYPEGLKSLKKSFELKKEIYPSEHIEIAVCHNNFADIYSRMGMYDIAEEHIIVALTIYERNNLQRTYRYWSALSVYGNLCFLKNSYEESNTIYRNALRLADDIFGHVSLNTAKTLQSIGNNFFYLNNIEEGMNYKKAAEKVLLEICSKDEYVLAEHYITTSTALLSNGKYKECIEVCVEALENEDVSTKELIYNNIGVAHFYMENYDDALKYYNFALDIYSDKNKQNFGIIYINKAVLGLVLGYYQDAKMFFEKGIELYDLYGAPNANRFIAYVRAAECLYWDDSNEKAIEMCELAERMITDGYIDVTGLETFLYTLYADIYERIGEIDRSKIYRNKTIQ